VDRKAESNRLQPSALLARIATRGLARDSAASFVFFGFTLLLNMATGVLVARELGARGRGELTAIMNVPALATSVFALGCGQAAAYHLARNPKDGGRLIGTWLVILLPTAAVAILVVEAAIPALFAEQTAATERLARLYALTLGLGLAVELLTGIVLGDQDFIFFNLVRILPPLTTAIAYVALWLTDRFTVSSALAVNAALGLLVFSVTALRPLRRHRIRGPDRQLARTTAWYGIRAHSTNFLGIINGRLDLLIMPAFLTAPLVGRYAVATNLSWIVVTVGGALSSLVLPASAARAGVAARRTVLYALYATVAVSVILALALGLVSGVAVQFLYGPGFVGSVEPLRIMLPGCVLYAAALVLASGLYAANRPFTAALAQVPGLLVTAIGLPLFLRAGGIIAAAIISTAAYTAVFIATVILYRRVTGIPWRSFVSDPGAATTADGGQEVLPASSSQGSGPQT
jgi:O-antigen/teichoic acid export membrane protein